MAEPKKTGRPRIVSDEEIHAALDAHSQGVPLIHVCRDMGLAYSTVNERCHRDPDLSVMHARAREGYAANKVAQMYDIANTTDEVPRARLLVDIAKWEVAKVLPKLYGDKIQAVDADGNQLSIVINKLV